MRKGFLLLILIPLLQWTGYGQCSDFIIYHSKGDVKMATGGGPESPVTRNMRFSGNSRLTLGAGAALILLSGKDKALRITEAGTYTHAAVTATCMKNQSSLTKDYLNYVAQSILEKGEPKTAMVIKGAVYRTRTVFEPIVMVLPADSSVVTGDEVTFSWRGSPGEPLYLMIFENGVTRVFEKLLADTSHVVETTHFKPGVIYFWLVSKSSDPPDSEPRFTFVAGETDWQFQLLDMEWESTLKELDGEADALQKRLKKE